MALGHQPLEKDDAALQQLATLVSELSGWSEKLGAPASAARTGTSTSTLSSRPAGSAAQHGGSGDSSGGVHVVHGEEGEFGAELDFVFIEPGAPGALQAQEALLGLESSGYGES